MSYINILPSAQYITTRVFNTRLFKNTLFLGTAFIYGCVLFSFTLAPMVPVALAADNTPPTSDTAFELTLAIEKNNLIAHWSIKPDTYLYQSRLKINIPQINNPQADSSDHLSNTAPQLLALSFPKGEAYQDADFGEQLIYKNQLDLPLAFNLSNHGNASIPLSISYQGCATSGFCYPPKVKHFIVHFQNGRPISVEKTNAVEPFKTANTIKPDSVQHPLPHFLPQFFNTHNTLTLFLGAFLVGIVLCFTPCVLPMVPMLSTLIIGKQNLKTWRAFGLSSVYVLSMSITYAIGGIIAALLGQRIQTAFQSPWILSAFAGLFVILGLELAGHLSIAMPDFIKSRLYQLQNKPQSGTFLGAMALGVLATLVASPCVSAPLMGVLGYITQTGNLIIGGLTLFAIGLGMGTPLIIAGTLGGKYLPKVGQFMQNINYIFRICFFAFAIWILERFLPTFISLPLWAILCLYIAYRMGCFNIKMSGVMPRVGMLFVVYAGVLLLGTFQGATDPLQPLAFQHAIPPSASHLAFNKLSSVLALEQNLNTAHQNQQPTMVEFYADWCTTCKKMEKHTLNHPEVKAQLKNWHLVQANVTANELDEQALLKKFQLVGPPSILFFDKDGNEQTHLRLTGEVKPEQVIEHLKKVQVAQN